MFSQLSVIAAVLATVNGEASTSRIPLCQSKTIDPAVDYTVARFQYAMPYLRQDYEALFTGHELIGNEQFGPRDILGQFRRANIYGSCLRVAFHDAGEFNLLLAGDKLGPDGCLSDSEPNHGLIEAGSIIINEIEPIWQKYCEFISRADMYVLIGKWAAERGDLTQTLNIPFHIGRQDALGNCDSDGSRLPNHQIGFDEFTRVFVNQMGMSIFDAVVVNGAHTVGHVHPENSGFGFVRDETFLEQFPLTNAWSEAPDSFDADYFASLILEPWKNMIEDNAPVVNKNFWFVDELVPVDETDPNSPLVPHFLTIMLNSDMSQTFVIDQSVTDGVVIGTIGEVCGAFVVDAIEGPPAVEGTYGCVMPDGTIKRDWPIEEKFNTQNALASNVYEQANQYILNPAAFLFDFPRAYNAMTSVGYGGGNSKLGTLQEVPAFGNYWSMKAPKMCEWAKYCAQNSDCSLGLRCNLFSAGRGQCREDTTQNKPAPFTGPGKFGTCLLDSDCKNIGMFCLPSSSGNINQCQFGGGVGPACLPDNTGLTEPLPPIAPNVPGTFEPSDPIVVPNEPRPPIPPPEVVAVEWCQGGVFSQFQSTASTCCAGTCGTCGGGGCSSRPGGAASCCTSRISRACTSPTDTVCIVPAENIVAKRMKMMKALKNQKK